VPPSLFDPFPPKSQQWVQVRFVSTGRSRQLLRPQSSSFFTKPPRTRFKTIYRPNSHNYGLLVKVTTPSFRQKSESRIAQKYWIPGRASLARNDDFLFLSRVLQEALMKGDLEICANWERCDKIGIIRNRPGHIFSPRIGLSTSGLQKCPISDERGDSWKKFY
jgi:hypothetical protein